MGNYRGVDSPVLSLQAAGVLSSWYLKALLL